MATANLHRYENASISPIRRCPPLIYAGVMSLVWLPVVVLLAALFFPS